MHQIFSIAELVGLVVAYFAKDNRTLTLLARTNTIFNSASIPILWRFLNSLCPLFNLLPQDALELEQRKPVIIRITRKLSNEDWARFNIYAPHVGSLRSKERLQILSPEGFLSNGQPLLRNLWTLHWPRECLQYLADVRSMCCFLTSTLVNLDLDLGDVWEMEDAFGHFTEATRMKMFNIVNLTIEGGPRASRGTLIESPQVDAITNLIPRCPNIRHFGIDQKLGSSLAACHGSLIRLESLQFYSRSRWVAQDSIPPITSLNLPSLRDLMGSYYRAGLPFWRSLLPLVGRSLRDLQLSPLSESSNLRLDQYANMYSVISSTCPNLTSLLVVQAPFILRPSAMWASDILRPVTNLSKLTRLMILGRFWDEDVFLGLSDADILHIASALPCLHVLMLTGRSKLAWVGEGDDPRPTLSLTAVAGLVENCRDLFSLTLTVDATHLPPLPRRDATSEGLNLDHIDFKHSWIEDPWEVAKWLANVCPASGISSARYETPKSAKNARQEMMWARVQEMMKVLQLSAEAYELRREVEVLQTHCLSRTLCSSPLS